MEKAGLTGIYRVRLRIIVLLVLVLLGTLVGRLFTVQVLQHDSYLDQANGQQKCKVDIVADRGRITDRRGVVLAISRDRYTLYLGAEEIDKVKGSLGSLASAIGMDPHSLQGVVNRAVGRRGRILIKRRMTRQEKEEVEALGIEGVSFDMEKERYYPHDDLAAQVIGYAGIDNDGLAGIEGLFDDELSGMNGMTVLQVDGLGQKRINPDFPIVPPRNGKDVVLTIDSKLQEMAEAALDQAIESCGAKSGTVIVVKPFRGEILALACYPRLDLNEICEVAERDRVYAAMRNRAITDLFEPGSTFKIVTFAGILERGLGNLDDMIYCENGKYLVHNHYFHDTHKYQWLKVREVGELSSNIGVIKLAERLGADGLYQMARKFGFGSRTGVEFPGEAEGTLERLDKWSGLSLPSIAIGQEVCVTPLQMAMAYAAIANGGFLMKPILVKEIWDNNGEVVRKSQPEVIREVMSRETAERLKEVLVGVVDHGTGKKTRIEGIRIAGKTGTAQKGLPGRKGYVPGKYVTSFGGFFPADHPKYAVFVMLDEPERNKWGGASAAPLFRDLVESTIYSYDGILGGSTPLDMVDSGPEMDGRYSVLRFKEVAGDSRTDTSARFDEPPVYDLTYSAGEVVGRGPGTYPFIPRTPLRGKTPDVSGKSLREAVGILSRAGLRVKIRGMGRVTRQEPAPGESYARNDVCVLWGEAI